MPEITHERSVPLLNNKSNLEFALYNGRLLFVTYAGMNGQYACENTKVYISESQYNTIVHFESFVFNKMVAVRQRWILEPGLKDELLAYFKELQFFIEQCSLKTTGIVIKSESFRTSSNENLMITVSKKKDAETLVISGLDTDLQVNLDAVGVHIMHQGELVHLQLHFKTGTDTYQGWYMHADCFEKVVSFFRQLGFAIKSPDPLNHHKKMPNQD